MVQLGRLGRVLSKTVFFPLGSEVVLSSLIDKGATRNIMSKLDIIFTAHAMCYCQFSHTQNAPRQEVAHDLDMIARPKAKLPRHVPPLMT